MTAPHPHFDLKLDRRAIFKLPQARGVNFVCQEGTVWITQDGDLRDHVLERGDAFRVSQDGPVLIYAMRSSSLAVCADAADSPPVPLRPKLPRRSLVFEQVLA